MAKKSTIMVARHASCCPLCLCLISKGDKISVYNNAWYHPKCCELVYNAIKEKRILRSK